MSCNIFFQKGIKNSALSEFYETKKENSTKKEIISLLREMILRIEVIYVHRKNQRPPFQIHSNLDSNLLFRIFEAVKGSHSTWFLFFLRCFLNNREISYCLKKLCKGAKENIFFISCSGFSI